MTRLEEIRQRWARMNRNKYGVGRLEKGSHMELGSVEVLKDQLVVYSDRPPLEGMPPGVQCINAICGPIGDSDSLEDVITYAEAPTDVAYLLQLLNEASDSLEWALDQLEEAGIANIAADKTAAKLKGKE